MKITRTCCTRHCGNGCGLLVTEHEDGTVKITGDPDHPFTRGFICGKTARFMDRLQADDRIIEPMIKENGRFRRASWNEALDLVAGKINALRGTPERMLHVFYVASYGLLFRASSALFGRLGAADISGDYCLDAGITAQIMDFGSLRQPMWEDLDHSRRLVNWGRNLNAQAMLVGREIQQRRQQGLKVLSVTPGDHGYKAFSDDIIVIRPGTDRFLALAVVRLLMERGSDLALARDRAFNWMEFEALAGLQNTDMLLEACGVSRAKTELLADYYQDGPTATVLGCGLQRYAFGGENVRFVDALALCAGWIGVPGGGVYFSQGDRGHIRYDWFKRPDPAPRSLPVHDLGAAITKADPPIEFIYVDGTNVVNQAPAAAAVRAAMEKPFVVSVEAFMNDTALVSDVILPPALLMETEDITRCSSHGHVHHSAQVFPPRKGVLSNFEICREIAARLDPPLSFPEAEEVMAEGLRAAKMTTDLETLRGKGYVPAPDMELPYSDGRFDYSDGLARMVDTLHLEPAGPEGYPLRLLSFVTKKHLLSQVPEREQTGLQTLWLSSDNTQLRTNGGELDIDAPCVLGTEYGQMDVRVETLEGLHPEGAYIHRGGWLKTGWGINALIGPHEGDLAGQCAYYSQWCRVKNKS